MINHSYGMTLASASRIMWFFRASSCRTGLVFRLFILFGVGHCYSFGRGVTSFLQQGQVQTAARVSIIVSVPPAYANAPMMPFQELVQEVDQACKFRIPKVISPTANVRIAKLIIFFILSVGG